MSDNRVIDRRVSDPATAASIRETARAANKVLSNEIIQAILRGPVTVSFPAGSPSSARVQHGLGHAVSGYIVVRSDTGVVPYDMPNPPADDPSVAIWLSVSKGAANIQLIFW